jgi:hypothetical protein
MVAGKCGGSKSSGKHEGLSFLFRDHRFQQLITAKNAKVPRNSRRRPRNFFPKMEIEDESGKGVILDAIRRFSERNV